MPKTRMAKPERPLRILLSGAISMIKAVTAPDIPTKEDSMITITLRNLYISFAPKTAPTIASTIPATKPMESYPREDKIR